MKKKKRRYIRLFSIPEKAEKAKKMILAGYVYGAIAKKLGCDRTSVIYFHKKWILEQETLKNFNGVLVEITPKYGIQEDEVNEGSNYKDYLSKYDKERKKLQSKNMVKAKKTIAKVKKYRIKNHLEDMEVWDY